MSSTDCSTILLSLDNSASNWFQLELPGSTISSPPRFQCHPHGEALAGIASGTTRVQRDADAKSSPDLSGLLVV